jgi:MFS family permease
VRLRARQRMDQFFTLPADTPTSAKVARLFRRNFFVNFVEGTTWAFGTSFLSVTAILPVYATRLTSSPFVIGLIPALMDAGWFLPQLLMAPSVERKRRQLPAVAWLSVWERLPFLALAIAALWLDRLPRGIAVAVFLVIMVWRAVLSGLVAMPWQELIARIIPVSHRGRFFGVTHLVGQLVGLPGAALAALILARLPYPRNFALCFLIGFLGWVVSYIFLVMTVEPHTSPANAHPRENQVYLVRLRAILKQNANFRAFLVSRWLAYLGGMANGFMAVYAVQHFALPDAQAAVFTGILFAGGVIGYPIWGTLGDRIGHKRVLELAGTLWLGALLVALLAPTIGVFYAVFALMGLGSAGTMLADLNIAMEFGPESERPTYVGLARTTTGPALFLAPVLAGAIVQWADYPIMFLVSLAFAAAGLATLWFGVFEPRRSPADPALVPSAEEISLADRH